MQADASSSGCSRPCWSARRSRSSSPRNPVHSVLFLILAFVNAAGLFLLMGAEFLGMILIVVYVGAVAVLFLFVVMMLDVDFAELKQGFVQYLPIGGVIAAVVARRTRLRRRSGWTRSPNAADRRAAPSGTISNTAALGRVLYTHYFFFFQAAGLILLTAMIGAIVLTLRAQGRRQAAEHRRRRSRARPQRPSSCAKSPRAPAFEETRHDGHRPYPLSHARGDPVHDRHRRHLPQPQEHHRHPDVGRADPACRSTSISSPSRPSRGDLDGQVFALFILTVAAAEAAIGLAILVAYFRNRGTIAVEDINPLKG